MDNYETGAIRHESEKDEYDGLNPVLKGFLNPLSSPSGLPKEFWLMKQKLMIGKNKLPRNFKPSSGLLEVNFVDE